MKFKEKYLAGELAFEAIDDYIEEWGNSDSELTLANYLGLTAQEEAVWIDDSDEALEEMLAAQRDGHDQKGNNGDDEQSQA